MKKTRKELPQAEWDFSAIEDLALPDATIYEYARSSDKLRASIQGWLNTKVGGKRVWVLLSEGRQSDPATRLKISQLGHAAVGSFELFSIIKRRPDFPAPWLAAPGHSRRNPIYKSIELIPMGFKIGAIRYALSCGDSIDEIEERHRGIGDYSISIKWDGATVNSIVSDFEKWIRVEAKKHPEMKRRGKPGQSQNATLTWLSAYRLSRAGFTYPEAQKMLEERKCRSVCHHPIYKDPSGWSDAIGKAKRMLSDLESSRFPSWLLIGGS